MTLGSLFDGSGGFPLAGVLNGIEPVWASEIEPFPIRVTKNRFPNMKHLGSVTDINGAEIEPVDIITFGSPCQDLSVAGKQLGIHDGQRSNLFFEAIRIIKEMRNHDRATGRADDDLRPRFAVWENVPGAFSSNKGHDFCAVLEAFCTIRGGQDHIVPMPPKGKWNPAGCIVGDGWSLAWRVYDAQLWGVPQRRKRIYLIADFGSERAGEILFERESVPWHFAQGREAWEGTAADAEGSVGRSGGVRCYALDSLSSNSMKSKNPYSGFHEEQFVKTLDTRPDPTCNQGGNIIVECAADNVRCLNPWDAQSIRQYDVNGVAQNINANSHGGQQRWGVCYALKGNFIDRDTKQNGIGWRDGEMYTLDATDRHAVALDCRNTVGNYELSATLQAKSNGGYSPNYINPVVYEEVCVGNGRHIQNYTPGGISGTLDASYYKGPGARNGKEREFLAVETEKAPRKYIVRRLTPTECARLQGFPDWWCDGADGSDSAQYKLWGNGIALPCAVDVIGRIAKELKEDK